MIIKHAKVYTKDQTFTDGDIHIENGVFTAQAQEEDVLDAKGCYAIPGLIDLHFHGCAGSDICDGTMEAISVIAEHEAAQGITGICPATMTLPYEELLHILHNAAAWQKNRQEASGGKKGADLLGINMEGPFISTAKKGAQDPKHIVSCDIQTAQDFLDASGGLVKFIGIAPEQNPDFR